MNMSEKQLQELVEISRFFGRNKNYVIAGGGNTSFKSETDIWVKASGTSLGNITSEGFAMLDRKLLREIATKKYSTDPGKRESEVKADFYRASKSDPSLRPSVETSLHEAINYPFVVHTHPTVVNAVTCSVKARESIEAIFGDEVLFVAYTDPGYTLFLTVRNILADWRRTHPEDPHIIFMQNHGVFVAANTTSEVKHIYHNIETRISEKIRTLPDDGPAGIPDESVGIIPALRMIMSPKQVKIARLRNSSLAQHFVSDPKNFERVSLPFTPDEIVYCKPRPLYLGKSDPEDIIVECRQKTDAYFRQYGYMPKIIGLRGYGIMAFEESAKSVETMLDVFNDWMKISFLSENFGGPNFLVERDIAFIDSWEVENYRRRIARDAKPAGRVENKIVIVTGGAQGFGAGISTGMMAEGANVVIADINNEKGRELAASMNSSSLKNEAVFIQTDVADPASVEYLMAETVKRFGGLDVLISNAGILMAGGIDEITVDTFELMTRVNYSAYFLCTKYAAAVLKLQSAHKDNYYTDIIQINSKSGLRGSNKNFTYAGGKFGGIGLTQSFALELLPYRIKVNAICPGNFFEGPLWSDPENGLFVQYLKAGKVPGAKSIADVKAHYEKQVPAGRGCQVTDVLKAIYYAIDQEYETGQAIPVTGGQEMLK
jgi:rhamnose utilization protein RhaD (predicted bifunctional aldolase and dehydrogenase)/NAD(P)-dependent dehydrogenase (short-subunit alcohol dehydrogenase family)